MLPKNRNEFIEYCLRRLGKPLLQINVSKEQVDDRVDDALEMFKLRHNEAMEETILYKQVTFEESQLGYIVLPDEVIGVSEVFSLHTASLLDSSDIFSAQYLMAYNDFIYKQGVYSNAGGYANFYIWQVNRATIDWLFRPDQRFEYNKKTQKLYLYKDTQDLFDATTPVVIAAYLSIGEHQNIWSDQWLRDYTTNLIKRQWAENVKKFGNLTLPSGVTLNGDTMYQEAITELQRLEDILKFAYELPSDFFLG